MPPMVPVSYLATVNTHYGTHKDQHLPEQHAAKRDEQPDYNGRGGGACHVGGFV